jgi:hypothetical protein
MGVISIQHVTSSEVPPALRTCSDGGPGADAGARPAGGAAAGGAGRVRGGAVTGWGVL